MVFIYINVFMYLATLIFSWMGFDLNILLGLVPYLVIKKYYIWQLFTYMFLHGSIFHLLFNMLMLWMFGSELCSLWGKHFFIKYYLICGLGGGLCVTALSLLFTEQLIVPTVGASGAIFGLFLAYGIIFKDKILYVFGIIPIKARPLVIIMGVIELLSLLSERTSSISHLAHLGGLFSGLAYLKMKTFENKLKIKRLNNMDNIIFTDFNKKKDKDLWN
ncbi:MAG: rhomboid family intramembrane serine protease [bacterium]